jgi:glutathione synthase/RimK-type ligase-like ATP-grasp enzyme
MTILITDGRAIFAVDLARHFARAGHRVVAVDHTALALSRFSRAVDRYIRLPRPTENPAGFADALAELVEQERVDLVVAAAESVLHLAALRHHLPSQPLRFVDRLDRLRHDHHKWHFAETARSLGLDVPRTRLLCSTEDALAVFDRNREVVYKPVYSRFGTHVLIRPDDRDQVASLAISAARPWVAQDFVEGRLVNSYSVVHQGRITAHCAYGVEFALGHGAGVAGTSLDHPGIRAWAERYLEATAPTGQYGFDFIERPDGSLTAVECNPRATSGVHYFEPGDRLVDAIHNPDHPPVEVPAGRHRMSKAMMRGLFPSVAKDPDERARWRAVYRRSRDVVGPKDDPGPQRWLQPSNGEYVLRSLRERIPLTEAIASGSEWDADPAELAPLHPDGTDLANPTARKAG